jgi:hypothetical protein
MAGEIPMCEIHGGKDILGKDVPPREATRTIHFELPGGAEKLVDSCDRHARDLEDHKDDRLNQYADPKQVADLKALRDRPDVKTTVTPLVPKHELHRDFGIQQRDPGFNRLLVELGPTLGPGRCVSLVYELLDLQGRSPELGAVGVGWTVTEFDGTSDVVEVVPIGQFVSIAADQTASSQPWVGEFSPPFLGQARASGGQGVAFLVEAEGDLVSVAA